MRGLHEPVMPAVEPEQVMSGAGKTFYRAARLLPASIRPEVFGLYAFCRNVDDLADESSATDSQRETLLEQLEKDLLQGGYGIARQMQWPFAGKVDLRARAAALLVAAARGDLKQCQPRTQTELLQYAFGVAGTVGLMMADLFGAEAAGLPGAVALGLAMQLSNIARDVAADYEHGRLYLPAEWIDAVQVTGALRGAGTFDERRALAHATRRVLRLADPLYEMAYDSLWTLPVRLRWSILAAAMCYRAIGTEVGRNVEVSWRQRTVVTNGRKLLLITAALFRLCLPRFWRRPRHRQPAAPGLAEVQIPLALLGVAL